MTGTAVSARRCQIREAADIGTDSGLAQHVANADNAPACGTPERPWRDKPMQAVLTGPGEVTCQRKHCAR